MHSQWNALLNHSHCSLRINNSHGKTINGILISWSFTNPKKKNKRKKKRKEMFWSHSILFLCFCFKFSGCRYWTFWNLWCHRIISNEPLYNNHNKKFWNSQQSTGGRCALRSNQFIIRPIVKWFRFQVLQQIWTLAAENVLLAGSTNWRR